MLWRWLRLYPRVNLVVGLLMRVCANRSGIQRKYPFCWLVNNFFYRSVMQNVTWFLSDAIPLECDSYVQRRRFGVKMLQQSRAQSEVKTASNQEWLWYRNTTRRWCLRPWRSLLPEFFHFLRRFNLFPDKDSSTISYSKSSFYAKLPLPFNKQWKKAFVARGKEWW